jgi:hypothetical protein
MISCRTAIIQDEMTLTNVLYEIVSIDFFSLLSKVIIDSQRLFDQMLPWTYQQNSASVMRTNYPNSFANDVASDQTTDASQMTSETSFLVRNITFAFILTKYSICSMMLLVGLHIHTCLGRLQETYRYRTSCTTTVLNRKRRRIAIIY